ncbi:hypothetical protein O6H91_12G056300 [Diphasiastrum complanatum]|uniref:Uncharacterized protein n=10 Tax=Diphasiastrum complanatum TaxID=34168 RepID=A0ACC2C267_DIPCM|nr:hypothetical protein O6H91_12G056300 [Diphasiastrum complanatum]KAJ7536092.1 hypothetical protein O6H91_12G056300 [Diphasiastrum complanatum]KAJ7536093.1 hypothetical protein O6H91_12G056300 [Diphasiastrum complanatum]KAJ7536094.1 hypothetical protein O6H91_12G056300 [Diphasiastrum complanatum]KAJ7536095.1 hypothetical protein O6H91_12G056300 [Diphasiastrum complanatum]
MDKLKQLLLTIMMSMMTAMLTKAADPYTFLDWTVSYMTVAPLGQQQQVIAINGMFPGPILTTTTNRNMVINVQNNLDEPFLLTWDGIQLRRNSWQDGVSGTNCPIPSGQNWTYDFQVKDQIGSYFYWPTTLFQRTAGGFGGIQVHPRSAAGVTVPFGQPEGDYFVLIGDWYAESHKSLRAALDKGNLLGIPDGVLINGKGSFNSTKDFELFTVRPGFTYRFRISNVGIALSLNFRIQEHQLYLVETEGSYTSQQYYDSLDIHVGQSYSILVTANQNASDYYIVASPRFVNLTIYQNITGIAILHYTNSTTLASGPLPDPPSIYDTQFSQNQARSIRRNLTTGAARPNPQGSYHYGNINITQTFQLYNSHPLVNGKVRFAVNDMSYTAPTTPLKLADYYNLTTNVFKLDLLPNKPQNITPTLQTSVISGIYQGFMEIIFQNTDNETVQSWHIDGYAVFVVGYDAGIWTEANRQEYNHWDAISRSSVQVFPNSWTAVLLELDNVGMWNIRSENLQQHYLGQEIYMRVVSPEPSDRTELPPPSNVLYCGQLAYLQPPSPKHHGHSSATDAHSRLPLKRLLVFFHILTWYMLQI